MFTKKGVCGRHLEGISIASEYPYPNPKPNPLQSLSGTLLAEIDFQTNVKNKINKMIGISYSNSSQS